MIASSAGVSLSGVLVSPPLAAYSNVLVYLLNDLRYVPYLDSHHRSHIPFSHMRTALSDALALGIQHAHAIIHQTRNLSPDEQSRLASLLADIVEPKLAQYLE